MGPGLSKKNKSQTHVLQFETKSLDFGTAQPLTVNKASLYPGKMPAPSLSLWSARVKTSIGAPRLRSLRAWADQSPPTLRLPGPGFRRPFRAFWPMNHEGRCPRISVCWSPSPVMPGTGVGPESPRPPSSRAPICKKMGVPVTAREPKEQSGPTRERLRGPRLESHTCVWKPCLAT